MGIEPTYPAWKAGVLPLNYTRISDMLLQFSRTDVIIPQKNLKVNEKCNLLYHLPEGRGKVRIIGKTETGQTVMLPVSGS